MSYTFLGLAGRVAAVAMLLVALHSGRADACHGCGFAVCQVACEPTVEVEEEYEVSVPYTQEVEKIITVNEAHVTQAEQTYTAMVPHVEIRKGTKRVVKLVAEEKTVTISRDFGRWVTPEQPAPTCSCEPACAAPCGVHRICGCHVHVSCDCVAAPACEPVWVPDVRTRDITVTDYRQIVEEVPYECEVTVHRPEERTRTVNVVTYKPVERKTTMMVLAYRTEKRTRTVCVPAPVCD